ncbi:MAG TPA: hypothetical protein VNZ45_04835 [Bacteroidia bacterium]|jgi:hypothetical protein|nr:hypothetical protein [Bacteroidia bacterium]
MGNFIIPIYSGQGGFAKNGYAENIEIEHPLKPGWLGVAFEEGYYINPFSLYQFQQELYPYSSAYTNYTATPYEEIPVLVGIFVETTIKKFTFEFKGVAGMVLVTPPYINATIKPGSRVDELPQAVVFSTANHKSYSFLAYSFGHSVSYQYTKHLSVHGNLAYFNDFSNASGCSSVLPLSQLHLEIGLAYHILQD